MKRGPGRPATQHGLSHSLEYGSWRLMQVRCYTHERYVKKGITVDPRWIGPEGFTNFLNDMGFKPDKSFTLERVDNDLGYYKTNCIWASRKQQNRNRSEFNRFVSFKGIKMMLCELSDLCGVGQQKLRSRIFVYGWPIERAIMQGDFRKSKK